MTEKPPVPPSPEDSAFPDNEFPKARSRTNWPRLIILLGILLCLIALFPERPTYAFVTAENGVYVYRDLSDADQIVEAIESDLTLDVVASQLRSIKYESIRDNLALIYGRAAIERAHRPYIESGRAVLLSDGCNVQLQAGYHTPAGTRMKKVQVNGGRHVGFEGYAYAGGDAFDSSPNRINTGATHRRDLRAPEDAPERIVEEQGRPPSYDRSWKQREIDDTIANERAKVESDIAQERAKAEESQWAEALKQDAIRGEVAAEEVEAARLYAMGWVGSGRDGRTIDEFMHLGEWKHPQHARGAMERAKAQEVADLKRHYADEPKRLAELLSSFESAKANRDQRMREETEYQKQRTRNPERYPDPYKHFFYPGEIKAWQKAQDAVGSGVSRTVGPREGEKQAVDQVAEEQVARVQAESEADQLRGNRIPSQIEMTLEEVASFEKLERIHQRTYDEILLIYEKDKEFIDYLRRSQRAWIAFRDAHVRAIWPAIETGAMMGTAERMCISTQLSALTKERLLHLQTWREGIQEGDLGSGTRATPEFILTRERELGIAPR